MIIAKTGKIVRALPDLAGNGDLSELIMGNVEIWKKTIRALDYYYFDDTEGTMPIWLENPLPKELWLENMKKYSDPEEYYENLYAWLGENLLMDNINIAYDGSTQEWCPNFILDQAYALERKLLEKGGYKAKDTDYNFEEKNLRGIRYFGSEKYKEIYVVGKSDPDVMTNAFVKFIDNQEQLLRKII